MSISRLCDIKQTLKRRGVSTVKEIIFWIIGKVSANLHGLHPSLRDLWNLIPLKYISYLHKVVLLPFHCFPWKGYNFHRLKDIFYEYSIKCMKELLFWLFYPIGCGPTTEIFYIPQIYTIWNRDKHTFIHYGICLLLTLLPYKLNIAVN